MWTYTGFGASLTVFGPLLQPIRETFNLAQAEMGLVFLVSATAFILSVLAGSTASDRYGRRPFVLAGPSLILLGFLTASVSPNWAIFLMASFIFGAGMGFVDGSLNALVIDVSEHSAASSLNYLHVFFGVGAFAGPLLVGVVLDAGLHWRWIAASTAGLSLTMLMPYFLVRFPPAAPAIALRTKQLLSSLFKPQPLLMLMVILFFVGMEATYSGWLPSYIALEFQASRGLAAYSLAFLYAGIVVGRAVSGLLVRNINHHLLIAATMGTSTLTGLIIAFTSTLPVALIGIALTGILIGGAFPTALAIGVRGQPAMVGALTGFILAGAGIAGAVFPPLTGLLIEYAGFKYAMLFPALLAIPATIAALTGYFMRDTNNSEVT